MTNAVRKIVIVGGGTAGWLAASIIAAHHKSEKPGGLKVSLIESSDIPTVGVGEGTWPTMKNTLRDIGLKESEFFKCCHATFKQGGRFVNWVHGNGDFYYHPFTVPLGYGRIDLAPYVDNIENYAVEANYQHEVCEAGLAPRAITSDEYQGQCNYAYHLDAGAFAEVLKKHCTEQLAVEHIVDTVTNVKVAPSGDIQSITLASQGEVSADLFVDCSGFASHLLGKALGVPFKSTKDILFNDSALAIQVPYADAHDPIACHTIATAQEAGWIWDIGLTTRRGIGHVYSSRFTDDEAAEKVLRNYIGPQADGLDVKKIKFESGYREQFWKNNCVAVGLAAGFVEPLEATALMLVEISARYIAENLPADDSLMPITAKRFNSQMHYRWQRIIDFLKLHYMLTKRPEAYWQANCDPSSIPESLKEDLAVWGYRGPLTSDFDTAIELFPAASYQYVIYGMGFKPDFSRQAYLHQHQQQAQQILNRNKQLTEQMILTLPPHREYIEQWLARAG